MTHTDTPGLLPCPFCGGTELTVEGAPDERPVPPERGLCEHPFAYAVFCAANNGDCGAGPSAATTEGATTAWNQRADTAGSGK